MRNILLCLIISVAGISVFPLQTAYGMDQGVELTTMEGAFDFDNVAEFEEVAPLEEANMELIRNNLKYVIITACLYAFSLVIITLLMMMTPEHMAKDVVTAIGLVSVIFALIILVLVVDTTDALTAPMGILGAIAGYLFGSSQKQFTEKEPRGPQARSDASG